MGWKNLSYWLKGGLIAVIITIVTGILMSAVVFLFAYSMIGYIISIPDIIIALPYRSIAKFFVYDVFGLNLGYYVLIGSYIVAIIPNFFIGAIIGWIVGKVKSRKQETK